MKGKFRQKSVRLSKDVIPERYVISLKPDLEAFIFSGKETITLRLAKATKSVTLHSKNLEIESVEAEIPHLETRFPSGEKGSVFALKISYDTKAETATFLFPKNLPKGEVKLHLVFKGVLNDLMRGFYRSRYEHDGKMKHLATTQFESTDARQAFPCFDEPAMKAVFDISLIVPTELTAISNTMPSNIREHEAGYKVVTFEPTPKMSTYLAAFIVGDFESIEGKTSRGTLVRIFTTPGKIHQAKFALEVAKKSLTFFEKYFDIEYPLPTLDIISIPDFQTAAMENWGAITFRESALLYDEGNSSVGNKQTVAIVIAHEIAHQWFGNLVTMEWWTHLWLNEGFASYIEYLAVDSMFPEWDMWTQFLSNDHGTALELDSLQTTHPIEVPIHHPDEISETFDSISYSKGASVIRMLAEYLGYEDFRKGLSYYLKKHSYANASTEHLWQAFQKISGKPVVKIMKNWTGNPGYPLLQVAEGKGEYIAHQSRFFSSPISAKSAKDKTLWHIPLLTKSNNGKVERTLSAKKVFTFPKKAGSKWTKINYGESGFFRTAYPKEMLAAFQKPIQDKIFGAIDRLGILRDAFALLEADKTNIEEVLPFVQSFVDEDNYTVWNELASGLSSVASVLPLGGVRDSYRKYSRNIFSKIVKKVGWEKRKAEKHTTTLLRSLVLLQAGLYGDDKTLKHAQKLFKNFIERGVVVHADVRSAVYTLVARYGGAKEHSILTKMYKQEKLQEEHSRIARALSSFSDTKLLEKTLAFAFSKDVRSQDAYRFIIMAWRNPYGQECAWRFVKKNWKELLSRYGGAAFLFPNIVETAGVFATREKAREVEQFFRNHPAPGASRAVHQALEHIRSNTLWRERLLKTLPGFLKKQK